MYGGHLYSNPIILIGLIETVYLLVLCHLSITRQNSQYIPSSRHYLHRSTVYIDGVVLWVRSTHVSHNLTQLSSVFSTQEYVFVYKLIKVFAEKIRNANSSTDANEVTSCNNLTCKKQNLQRLIDAIPWLCFEKHFDHVFSDWLQSDSWQFDDKPEQSLQYNGNILCLWCFLLWTL